VLALLEDDHPQARSGGSNGRSSPCRTSADDGNVVMLSCHASTVPRI
jgi:hypothetical protein